MLFYEFTVGTKEYKCRLNTRGLIELEKKLGCNPLNIFMSVGDNVLPRLEELIYVLHYSLQPYNHGISLDDTYEIYDHYIEEGKTFMDFIQVIMEIYKVSGLIKEEAAEEKN